jgi:lipopolysaccharide/colanic/teichoic acid biosynthesis glycosyltransferase
VTGVLLTLLLAVVAGLVVAETKGGFLVAARAVVRAAARRLPRDGERWREEWMNDLDAKGDRPVTALIQAIRIYRDARRMRVEMLPRPELTDAAKFAKRAVDLLISAMAMVACAPLLVMLALAVKLASPGPVLYRAPRRGKDGRIFYALKFRTMRQDGPPGLPFTRVGRFLRRWSLDELPQLFNVVRGDMSLVGPPARSERDAARLNAAKGDRPKLTPGLTGPAQIDETFTGKFGEFVEREHLYIEGWSLWRDLRILLDTVRAVLRGPYR